MLNDSLFWIDLVVVHALSRYTVYLTVLVLRIFIIITPHDVHKLIDHRTLLTLCLQIQALQPG
jgi:hypothetical protein